MSAVQEQLSTFGFKELPAFDPEYFNHRARLGFLLLLNEKEKLSYHVFTINAHSCLYSARRVVEGEYEDRAQDFRDALKESALDDWVVYFRPNGLYPGLRQTVRTLVQDYRSLNTLKPRNDPNAATWAYQITHEPTKRSLTIYSSKEVSEEQALAIFLRKWRLWLDQSLERKSIALAAYYAGCRQQAEATKQWMDRATNHYSIAELPQLAGKERHEVVKHATRENVRQSHVYRKSLTAVQ